jgi:CO/xanthine dehydrogenase FAD-binding subunit
VACALMAIDATCEILSATNKIRKVSVKDFFTGVRKTVLKKNEVLQSISISLNQKGKTFSGFVKIGTRLSMECSVVSLAYHFVFDKKNKVISAGIAIGASAPTIKFTQTACDYVFGKTLNEIDREMFARKILEYATPISDIRGSAWYRKEVLKNISAHLFDNL